MERTDELLWEAYRQGDENAFPELVRRYQGPLFGYLMRMTGDRGTAEDLFQETFLRIHNKAHTFRANNRFKSWLYTIATRITIDHRRSRQSRPQLELLEHQTTEAASETNPATDAVQSELRATVQTAVETLPPQQRAALVLSYYQGHSYPEVAKIMGCSLGTVKTHMSRALKTLAIRLPEGGQS